MIAIEGRLRGHRCGWRYQAGAGNYGPQWQKALAAANVRSGKGIPPFLLFHVKGGSPTVADSEYQALGFAKALGAAGVRADVVSLDHVEHFGSNEKLGVPGDITTVSLERFPRVTAGEEARAALDSGVFAEVLEARRRRFYARFIEGASMRLSRKFVALAVVSLACAGVTVPPAIAEDSGRSAVEQSNLAFVLDFWNNVFMKRDASRFAEFFAADYVDHNPQHHNTGIAGFDRVCAQAQCACGSRAPIWRPTEAERPAPVGRRRHNGGW